MKSNGGINHRQREMASLWRNGENGNGGRNGKRNEIIIENGGNIWRKMAKRKKWRA
jgi:hypothetical protein